MSLIQQECAQLIVLWHTELLLKIKKVAIQLKVLYCAILLESVIDISKVLIVFILELVNNCTCRFDDCSWVSCRQPRKSICYLILSSSSMFQLEIEL